MMSVKMMIPSGHFGKKNRGWDEYTYSVEHGRIGQNKVVEG